MTAYTLNTIVQAMWLLSRRRARSPQHSASSLPAQLDKTDHPCRALKQAINIIKQLV